MPVSTTVGFEAEFANDPSPLIRYLTTEGLADQSELHGYHCDCDCCEVGDEYPAFRAQRDSSCGGEVISNIFNFAPHDYFYFPDDSGQDWFNVLADGAFEHDIEPGLDAGFHVHVGVSQLSETTRGRIVANFVKWEPHLLRFSGGRWERNRGFNTLTRTFINQYRIAAIAPDRSADLLSGVSRGADLWERFLFNPDTMISGHGEFMRLYQDSREWDRHANLNTHGRHRTFEFRLWNATRVAWRMRLWVGLSAALTDPEVVTRMMRASITVNVEGWEEAGRKLTRILDRTGYPNTALLLRRQLAYLTERAAAANDLAFSNVIDMALITTPTQAASERTA